MEKTLTTRIIKYINKLPGCFAYKRLSSGATSTNGFPDIAGTYRIDHMACSFAVSLEIEVKQKGEVPSHLQYARLRMFRRLGVIAFWTDDFDDCKEKLNLWSAVASRRELSPGYSDLMPKNPVLF